MKLWVTLTDEQKKIYKITTTLDVAMYILENKNQPTTIKETTFADLNMLESDI